jgi:hypothetical protein
LVIPKTASLADLLICPLLSMNNAAYFIPESKGASSHTQMIRAIFLFGLFQRRPFYYLTLIFLFICL